MKRLPPLTAIEAFVQVARLGSIKAAAEALSLSSPALSRRIQALERAVGRPLFERRHQALALNAEGEALLAEIGPPIDALGTALDRAAGAELRLRLAVPSLFAAQRLMPNLPKLRALHPELHIDLDTAPNRLSRLDDGLDAAIVITTDIDPALHKRRIESNRVIAIGARRLLEGPDALKRPADLARMNVLLHSDLGAAFDHWCRAAGVPGLEPAAADVYDAGQLILDAAAEGLGVAFMLESHLAHAADPRLVRLFDVAAESPYSYWFACRRSALKRRPVKLFQDWLFGELVRAD